LDGLAGRDGDFAVGGPVEAVGFEGQRGDADRVSHDWKEMKKKGPRLSWIKFNAAQTPEIFN
jgi:hypothetical protein